MDEETAKEKALKETFVDFFILQPLTAGMEGALSAGIMQGLANTIGMVKQKFSGKSEQQKTVDDMLSPLEKKKTTLNGVDTKVSSTMPVGTEITADFTGAVAEEAEMKPRVRNVADTIQRKTGIKIGFAEYYQNGQKNNAYKGHYDPKNKTIYFRKGASIGEIIYKTGMHELTHAIEGTKHYAYVSDYVLNKKFGGVESDKYKKAIAAKIETYKKNGEILDENEARRELVAEKLREAVFAKGEDVRRIVEQDYTFAQHVHDWIDSMLYWVKNTFGHMDEKAQLQADLEQAQRKYRMALAGAKGRIKNSIDIGFRYSIVDDRHIGKVAYLNGITIVRQPGETIETAIRKDFKNRFKNAIVTVLETGDRVKLDQIGKFVYDTSALRELKQRSYPVLDDMIRIANNKRWSEDLPDSDGVAKKHAGLDCSGGFNYFDTYFAMDTSIENDTGVIIYSGTIICRIDKHGRRYFYDLDDIREAGYRDESDIKSQYPFTNSNDLSYNDILTREHQTSQEKKTEKTSFNTAYEKALKKKRGNQFSFSSPKTDNAPAGVEDFDVQKKDANPELQKMLDDHVVVQSDGDVQQANPELQKSIADHEAVIAKKKAETKEAYDALAKHYGAIEKGEKPYFKPKSKQTALYQS